MDRIHIRHITLRSWFPPNDPIATAVARLCVLREDFFMELQGIGMTESIESLDQNSDAWRRMYFWRKSLRTLEEIRKTLNTLGAQEDFRKALSKEPQEIRDAFKKLKKEMNKASDEFLRDLGNTIGAHLDQKAFQRALNEMDITRKGLLELGDTLGGIHYKFSSELILAVLLQGVSDDKLIPKLKEILEKTAKLMSCLVSIDNAIACYARERSLH